MIYNNFFFVINYNIIVYKIVEVSNLSNHLYHDCEFKNDYRKCEKCNLAVRYDERSKHNKFHIKYKEEGKLLLLLFGYIKIALYIYYFFFLKL